MRRRQWREIGGGRRVHRWAAAGVARNRWRSSGSSLGGNFRGEMCGGVPSSGLRLSRRPAGGVVARRRETEFEQMLGEARLLVGGCDIQG